MLFDINTTQGQELVLDTYHSKFSVLFRHSFKHLDLLDNHELGVNIIILAKLTNKTMACVRQYAQLHGFSKVKEYVNRLTERIIGVVDETVKMVKSGNRPVYNNGKFVSARSIFYTLVYRNISATQKKFANKLANKRTA